MTDFKIDLRINEDGLNSAVKRAQENNIVIPTFAQLRDPVKNVPEKIKKALIGVDKEDYNNPLNLFRITWRNEPVLEGGA